MSHRGWRAGFSQTVRAAWYWNIHRCGNYFGALSVSLSWNGICFLEPCCSQKHQVFLMIAHVSVTAWQHFKSHPRAQHAVSGMVLHYFLLLIYLFSRRISPFSLLSGLCFRRDYQTTKEQLYICNNIISLLFFILNLKVWGAFPFHRQTSLWFSKLYLLYKTKISVPWNFKVMVVIYFPMETVLDLSSSPNIFW